MKIHGICLVKNEADIAEYFLSESVRWCDHIYVFDTGSRDHTWELVQAAATSFPNIFAFKKSAVQFSDQLRSEVFNQFRSNTTRGDWWCRLDADEIYVDDPRSFLMRVPLAHHVVWSIHLHFYLTDADLSRFAPKDEKTPPRIDSSNLPRYYIAKNSEPRFFRYRPQLEWAGGSWPRHLGLVTPERIRLKHFQYRSPAQIQLRLDTRREAAEGGHRDFGHSLERTWREKITDHGSLYLDERNGFFHIDTARLPIHMEGARVRGLKWLLHGSGIWP